MGHDDKHAKHVYDSGSEFPLMSFKELIETYGIKKIDYLKVDCEGGEYSFLNEENLEWISKNVRHMAIEIHLRATRSGKEDFIEFRDKFLRHFFNQGKVKFMQDYYKDSIWNDQAIYNEEYNEVPAEFMIYIKN
jgi:hypothetical protein